jgi:FkbM family methyltransferase
MSQKYNLHPHDVVFHGLSSRQQKVSFIQIGAADGKRADPIYHFVKRYKWEGVLVEPLPDVFELLKENYNNISGLNFENVAISEKNEIRAMSRIPLSAVEENKVPRWAFGISSLVPEKTIFSQKNSSKEVFESLQKETITENVKCITLKSLLDKYKVKEVDVLQIDTEGYDVNIIKQINFSEFKPKVINFEWQWLTEKEKDSITKHLMSFGYFLYNCGEDMLASLEQLENYKVDIEEIASSTIPKYFANLIGFITNTVIDSDKGASSKSPARIEFVKASREYNFAIPGDIVVSSMLHEIDGSKSVAKIAQIINCSELSVVNWITKLKAMKILE